MQESDLGDRARPSLSALLSESERPLADLSPEDQQERQFLLRLRELARGLVSSEYWELVSLVLIDGLETAKGALESETIEDRALRISQGEAKAYRSAFNLLIRLSKGEEEEEKNGR